MPTTSPSGLRRSRGSATIEAAASSYLIVASIAAAAGLLVARGSRLSLVLVVVPLALLALSVPAVVVVVGVALLPFPYDLAGGGPLNVSATDLCFVTALVGLLASIAVRRGVDFHFLRPATPWLWFYGAALACVTLVHLSLDGTIEALQRVQIVAVPIVAGALLVVTQRFDIAIRLYVSSCVVLALAFTLDVGAVGALGVQKNPAGQFMAGAILLLVGARITRPFMVAALPPLAIGIFATQSRGSLLGLAVGLAVLLAFQPGLGRLRIAAGLIPLAALFTLGFLFLPEEARERTTDVRLGQDDGLSAGAYTVQIRESYREDAERIFWEHPFTGVGIGQYAQAASNKVADPHNVLLLEAAEGGALLVGGFVVLIVGSTAVVARRRQRGSLAPTAVAVQASTLAHALVDVYWVRGTPVLGWLLVGAALAAAATSKERV